MYRLNVRDTIDCLQALNDCGTKSKDRNQSSSSRHVHLEVVSTNDLMTIKDPLAVHTLP